MLGGENRRGFLEGRGLDGGVGVLFLAGFCFWRGYGCHPCRNSSQLPKLTS